MSIVKFFAFNEANEQIPGRQFALPLTLTPNVETQLTLVQMNNVAPSDRILLTASIGYEVKPQSGTELIFRLRRNSITGPIVTEVTVVADHAGIASFTHAETGIAGPSQLYVLTVESNRSKARIVDLVHLSGVVYA